MSKIQEKLTAIIVDKLSVKATDVQPSAHLRDDLGADSLDTVELIMEFEEAFSITIPNEQAIQMTTVQQIIDYLTEHTTD